jgi:hypothetical protein
MPRLVKQLLYGLLYIAVFIGIPIGIYFALLKPAPTCWDGVQNGKEEGVDCGGNCPRACIPANLQPLQAFKGVKVMPLDAAHASVLVEVTNPNVDYAAPQFWYAIMFTDGTGATSTLSGSSYIYGGEVRDLVFPNLAFEGDAVKEAAAVFSVPQWVPASVWRRPALRIQHAATERKDGQLGVVGELVNDDSTGFPSVEVVAVFRGRFGEVAGVSRTVLENVLPGEPRAFTVLHPDIPGAELGATNVALSAVRR